MSKTEINKCLKELSKAKLRANNLKECAELCNYIGEKYSEKCQYQEAIHYHLEALAHSEQDGDSMGMALAQRCLGECHSAMSDFKKAEEHIRKYIRIVKNLANVSEKLEHFVEIQRAWTTLARTYLTQAQELMENDLQETIEFHKALDKAEVTFERATKLADSLGTNVQLSEKEYPEMKARLLLNMALVKDLKGNFKVATENLKEAIKICELHKLKQDLYLCQFNLANIYRQRGHEDCMKLLEASISTAKQLRNSKSKLYICDAYIQKGLLLLEKKAFQKDEAMKCFYLAYEELSKDEIPSDDDLQKAIRLLKISYVIYVNYNKLHATSLSSLDLMKTYDKLGDCFTELKMYSMAISYYEQALVRAKSTNRPPAELASIYISIAESYADNEQYERAIEYFEKELQCRQGNDEEQCRTLIKIALMKEYMKDRPESVIKAYNTAYSKTNDNPALRQQVLKSFVPYLASEDHGSSLHRRLEETLMNLQSYPDLAGDCGEEEEASVTDDVALDDILVEFQNDEDDEEGFKYLSATGRPQRTMANRCSKKFKVNDFGETPLHQACIKGDLKAVERLLDSNHPVNPVENSGWLPIHEACNNGHTEIVDLLIKRGAKIDFRGWMGITPLHDAARNGRFNIVELLIQNKANVIALDDSGGTPLDSLTEWKLENQRDMSNSQLSEYQQTKLILEDAMSKAGFNFQEHRVKRLSTRVGRYKGGASKNDNTNSTHPVKCSRRGADSPPPNPVKEYRSAMTDLRRTTTTKKHTIPDNASETAPSLGALTVKADIKDWMIDDVTGNKRGRKKFLRHGLDDDEYDDELECDIEMETDDVILDHEDEEELIILDNASARVTSNPRPPLSKGYTSPVFSEDDSLLNATPSLGRPTSPDIRGTRDPIPSYMLARDDTSSLTGSDRSAVPSTSSSTAKKSIKIEIDCKTMSIQADSGAKVQWLVDQVTERYMSFADLNTRPTVELCDENEDFPLFCKDLLQDVVHGKLKAIIKSWNLPPIFDRYIQACKEAEVKPLPRITNLNPSQLSIKLDNARNHNILDLSNCRVPRKHVVPLLKSMIRDDIQELNLSASNIILDDQSGALFSALPTLSNLTKLSLNCCGLDNKDFESLCRIKLWKVNEIYITYNNICLERVDLLNRLDGLSKNSSSIKLLDLRWNNIRVDQLGLNQYGFKILC